MPRIPATVLGWLVLLAALSASPARAGEWRVSGFGALQSQLFLEDGARPLVTPAGRAAAAGYHGNQSLVVQPEFYKSWNERRDSFTFVPFARLDQRDDERSHFDIRELTWLRAGRTWELRAGIRKVFWGVTESRHLVDIINQTDLVEDVDGEDKLGQPMVNLALIHDWGTLDLFLLPGFRERTFPGREGRLRSIPRVDTDRAIYESGAGQDRVDFAARWSRYIGEWDLGVSHFHGTSREPRFELDASNPNDLVLIPVYDQIDQTGLDVQYTRGAWLWKLEAIHRSGQVETFNAATGGFEYTLYGILNSDMDLGLLAEYSYDGRPDSLQTPFNDDLFTGLRLTLNDVQSTEALVGCVSDLEGSTRFCSVEASRRLGSSWVLSVEARTFSNVNTNDPLYSYRHDDYAQLELAWYF